MKTLDENHKECQAAIAAMGNREISVYGPQPIGLSCPDCGEMLMTNGVHYGVSPIRYGAQCDCGTKVSICSFSGRWERIRELLLSEMEVYDPETGEITPFV